MVRPDDLFRHLRPFFGKEEVDPAVSAAAVVFVKDLNDTGFQRFVLAFKTLRPALVVARSQPIMHGRYRVQNRYL